MDTHDDDTPAVVPFTRRIEDFRAWFTANEPTIAEGARRAAKNPADGEALVAFMAQGTAILSEDVCFNIGGEREFTFCTEGRAHLFFLYPRLVAALRGGALGEWTFHPWMQGSGGHVFELDIFGVRVSTDGVLVGFEEPEEEDGAAVDLRFHSPALVGLEETQAVSAFYVLLDNTIGEGLVYRCVASVARAATAEEGMEPLTGLAARLLERARGANGEEKPSAAFDPSERVFSYTREVEEKEDGHDLRGDIAIGTTRHMPVVRDYHASSPETWRAFAAFGAKPAFLYYYPDPDAEGRALIDQRYDLQEAIEAEVLGGPGTQVGLILGGAVGRERVYIDILLYDEDAFRERIVRFIAGFSRLVFLSEFRPNGDVTMLFDSSTPGLFQKLSDLHDAGRCGETAHLISAIPPEERGYDVQCLFARALNNIDRHEEALGILDSIRGQGEADPVWHFRAGYALYYLDREREAAPHFQRAIDLGQDDERTREFLHDCLAYDEDDGEAG